MVQLLDMEATPEPEGQFPDNKKKNKRPDEQSLMQFGGPIKDYDSKYGASQYGTWKYKWWHLYVEEDPCMCGSYCTRTIKVIGVDIYKDFLVTVLV